MILTEIVLDCGHQPKFQIGHAPSTGDTIWCYKCNYSAHVKHVLGRWMIKCRDCSYRREYGAESFTASVRAASHMTRRKHTVERYQDGNYEESLVVHSPQGELFSLDGLPPF